VDGMEMGGDNSCHQRKFNVDIGLK
jgi:hypothetical protein